MPLGDRFPTAAAAAALNGFGPRPNPASHDFRMEQLMQAEQLYRQELARRVQAQQAAPAEKAN